MGNMEKRDWEAYKRLATFDFKCLEYLKREKKILRRVDWKYYTAGELLKKLILILKTNNNFGEYNYEKWFDWKYEKEGDKIKQRRGADLDDSTRRNPWMRAVYYLLWGKGIEGSFSTSFLFEKMLLGGDTMNTIASYNDKEQLKGKPGIDKLCRECHQLGNFVLVPAYFNQWRGRNKLIKDQMDLSLYRLSNLEEFRGWSKSSFTKYINMFFLWDYVEPNDDKKEYLVKDMKTGSIEIVKINDENVDQYIANANKYIKRRGLFMAAILKIAVEFKGIDVMVKDEEKVEWKEWDVSDIYKYIVKNVFLTEETYSDYNDVIAAIKKAVRSKDEEEKIFDILDKAGELIENAENRLNNLEDGTCLKQ